MYDAETQVRVRASITDTDTGQPIDPGTVIFTVYDPSGNATTPTPSRDGTGAWSVEFVGTQGGDWYVAMTADDPKVSAQRKISFNSLPFGV